MSNSVDQRVVQMMFDNSQFEKGVSSTLQSLKALDEGLTLKKGTTGIEQVQKSVNGLKFDNAISQTSGFEKALGNLKSTAGGVFSSIMDAVGNMSSGIKVVTGLLGTGLAGMMVSGAWRRASNINMAEFKLSGMYEAMGYKGQKAADMVALAMQNASDAVDGTAYALDSAVMAASNLAASGVQAGDQLEGTLRSIAGLAAMSGRDYDSVAQIVSTVAGQGKLMTMQLRQFEMSGLNVAAVLADAFGTTEEAIRDMVTDGQVSFEVFSQVMEEKFAGAAAKANETFEGSLANIRAALSRTLASFFVYGQKGMVPIFNGIRVAINGINTALAPLLGENGVFTTGIYKALTKTGKALKKWAGYTEEYVKDAEGNMKKVKSWFHQDEIDKMSRFFQGIADALKTPIDILAQVLPNAMLTFMYVGGIIREVVRLFGELIAPVFTAFSNVFSDNFFGALTGWIAGLVKHIYDLVSAFHIGRAYGAALEGVFTALFSIIKAVSGVVGAVFTVAIRIALDVVFALIKAIEIVLDVLGTFIDMFSWAGEAIGRFVKRTVKTNHTGFGLIAKTFKNLAKGAKLFLDVVSGKDGAFKTFADFVASIDGGAGQAVKSIGEAFDFFGKVVSDSGTLIQSGGRLITDALYGLIKPALKPLREGLWNIGDGIVNVIKAIGDGIMQLVPEKIRNVANGITEFVSSILPMKAAIKGYDKVSTFINTFRSNLLSSDLYQKASSKIKEYSKTFRDFTKVFKDSADAIGKDIFDKLKEGAKGLMIFLAPLALVFNGLRQFLGLEELDLTAEGIENSFTKLKDSLQPLELADKASGALVDIGKAIADFIGSVKGLTVDNVLGVIDEFGILVQNLPFEMFAKAFGSFASQVAHAWTELSNSFSNGTFGIQSVKDFVDRVAGAFSRLGERLKKILPSIGTYLSDFFGKHLSSIGSDIAVFFGSTISSIFESIGEFFKTLSGLDVVKNLGLQGILTDLSNFFSTMVPGKISEIVGFIERFVSAVSSVASSAVGIGFVALTTGVAQFFSFMSGVGKGAIDFVISAIDKVKPLVGALSTYFSLVSGAFTHFGDAISEAWSTLTESFDNGTFGLDAIGKFVDTVKWQFSLLEGSVEYYLGKAWGAISGFFSNNLGSLGEDLKAFVKNGAGYLFQSIGDFIEGLGNIGVLKDLGLSEPLHNLAEFFTNVVPEKASKVIDVIGKFAGEISSGAFSVASSVLSNVSDAIKKFFDFVSSIRTRLGDFGIAVSDAFRGLGKLASPVTDFLGSVGRAFDAFFDRLDSEDISIELLESLWLAIQRSFERLLNRVVPIVSTFVDNIKQAFKDNFAGVVTDIGTFVGGALGNIPKAIGDALGALDSLGVFNGLKNAGFEKPLKALQDFFQSTAPSKIKELGESISNFLAPSLGGLMDFGGKVFRIFEGVDFLGPLKTFGLSVADALKTFFDAIDGQDISVEAVKNLAHSIADSFGEFLPEAFSKILSVGGQLFGAITSTLGGPFEKIASFGGDVFGKVVGFVKGFLEVLSSFDPTGILQNIDLSKPLASLKEFISEALDIDVSKLSGLQGVIETIKGIIKKLLSIGEDAGLDFSSLKMESGSVYRNLFQKYFGGTDDAGEEVNSVGEKIKGILEGFKKFINDPLGTIFDTLAKAVNVFAKKYSEFKSKINTEDLKTFIDDIAAVAKHAGGLVVLWEVVQMFENIGHFASSMARMADAFRSMAFALKNLTQSAMIMIRTQAILNIALAIGVLVAALAFLATQPIEKIEAVLPIIEKLLVELLVTLLILTEVAKISDSKSIYGLYVLTEIIKSLTLAIGVMAGLTVVLGKMDPAQLQQGAETIGFFLIFMIVLTAVSSVVPSNIGGLAGVFKGIAGALLVMALIVTILGSMDPQALSRGGALLIGLMVLLGALSAAVQHFSKGVAVGARSLIEMAGAILILTGAMVVLSLIPTSRLEGSFFTVLGLIAGMTGALIALTRFTKSADLAGATAALSGFAIAIGLVAMAVGALAIIGSLGGDLMAGTISILAIMGMMLAVIVAISLMGKQSKQAAKALMAFGVAVGILAVAVGALSLLPMKKLFPTMLMFAGIILVFAASLAVLTLIAGKFSVGAVLVIAMLISIGATAIMFAVSVGIMAESLEKMAVAMPKFANGIVASLKTLGNNLMGAVDSMGKIVMSIGAAIITGLLGLMPMALEALGTFVLGMVSVLVQYAPILGEGAILLVVGLINGIGTGIEEHGGEVLTALEKLFDIVVKGIADIFDGALTKFGDWLAELTGFGVAAEQQVSDNAANMSKEASESAKENNTIATDTESELNKNAQTYLDKIPGLKDAAEKYGLGGIAGLKDAASGFNFMEILHLDDKSMDLNLSQVAEKAKEMGVALPENITSMVENGLGDKSLSSIMDDQGFLDIDAATSMANDAGVTVATDGWGAGLEEGIQEYKLDGLLAGTGAVDLEAITTQFSEAGTTASTSFSQGFSDGLNVDGSGPVKKAAESMKMESTFNAAGIVDGKAAVAGIEKGLKNFADKAKRACDSAKRAIDQAKPDSGSSGKALGESIVEGMVSGINEKLPSLTEAVEKMEKLAERAFKAKAKINSPSKVFAALGAGLVEGLILGVESMQGNLVTVSEDTADAAISSVATQMSYMSDLLDDIEERPVIRPVLDLTDYNAGLAQMKGFDTHSQMIGAQTAMRPMGFGVSTTQDSVGKSGTNISIYLNYDASADANQIVMDIANGLEARLAMEGV